MAGCSGKEQVFSSASQSHWEAPPSDPNDLLDNTGESGEQKLISGRKICKLLSDDLHGRLAFFRPG